MNRSALRWLVVMIFSPVALLTILLAATVAFAIVLVVGLKSYADLTRSKAGPAH